MSVLGFTFANEPFDLGNNTALARSGGSVTIVSGTLRTGGPADYFLCDNSTSGAGGLLSRIEGLTTAGSGATQSRVMAVVQRDVVTGDGTIYDRLIFTAFLTTSGDQIYLIEEPSSSVSAGSNADGKVHLYFNDVSGPTVTEIDSANAFTCPSGAWGVRLTINTSTGAITLDIDDGAVDTDGSSWVTKQSGTSPVSMTAIATTTYCQNLSKGQNRNYKLRVSETATFDNGGSYRTTLPTTYLAMALEGRPNGEGTSSDDGWEDGGGTACSTGGTTCSAKVDDDPIDDTTYAQFVGFGSGSGTQKYLTFTTDSQVLGAGDTVWAVAVNGRARLVTGNNPQCLMRENGTDQIGGTLAGTTNMRWWTDKTHSDHSLGSAAEWTVTTAQAAEVGARELQPDNLTGKDVRVAELYKYVLYAPSTATVSNATMRVVMV